MTASLRWSCFIILNENDVFCKQKMKLGWSIRELKVGQGSIEGCKWQGGFGLPQISISKYKNEDLFIILFLWDVILRTQERSWKFHSHYFHYSNNPLIGCISWCKWHHIVCQIGIAIDFPFKLVQCQIFWNSPRI